MGEPEALEISPTFSAPPLPEVALAVEFTPIPDFGAVAMARLATQWRARYPHVQEHPPLPSNPPFGTPAAASMVVSVGAPQIRLWLLTEKQDRLVQLQRDRLVVNWRLASPGQPYPRYRDALRPEFANDYRQLLNFLDTEHLPSPRPTSTEVTYVNAIASGSVELHRRIARADSADMITSDAETGVRRPSSGVFKSDTDGISVYLESVLAGIGLTSADLVRVPNNGVMPSASGQGKARLSPRARSRRPRRPVRSW